MLHSMHLSRLLESPTMSLEIPAQVQVLCSRAIAAHTPRSPGDSLGPSTVEPPPVTYRACFIILLFLPAVSTGSSRRVLQSVLADTSTVIHTPIYYLLDWLPSVPVIVFLFLFYGLRFLCVAPAFRPSTD